MGRRRHRALSRLGAALATVLGAALVTDAVVSDGERTAVRRAPVTTTEASVLGSTITREVPHSPPPSAFEVPGEPTTSSTSATTPPSVAPSTVPPPTLIPPVSVTRPTSTTQGVGEVSGAYVATAPGVTVQVRLLQGGSVVRTASATAGEEPVEFGFSGVAAGTYSVSVREGAVETASSVSFVVDPGGSVAIACSGSTGACDVVS